MTDKQRLNFLAQLVRLPETSFHFQDDETSAELAGMPLGYTIRVDGSCADPVQASGTTFRRALDRCERKLKAEANY